jgi:archaemetzincin
MRAFSRVSAVLVLPLLALLLAVSPAAAAEPASPPVERVIALLPLGKVSQDVLDRVAWDIQLRLRVKVRVEPRRELPQEAYYPPRRRWRAEKLLEFIDASPPQGVWKVVGITEAEVSTTKGDIQDWGIAGLGSIQGLSCVVSTHIYRKHSKTRQVLLRRVGDLAVHELGHTLGFDHCETEGCVMADAKGKAIKSSDKSSGHYCERCLQGMSPEDRVLMKTPAPPR